MHAPAAELVAVREEPRIQCYPAVLGYVDLLFALSGQPKRRMAQRALQRIFGDAARYGAPSRSSTKLLPIAGALRIPEQGEDAVSLSEEILRAAIIRQASDIHIEPGRDNLKEIFMTTNRTKTSLGRRMTAGALLAGAIAAGGLGAAAAAGARPPINPVPIPRRAAAGDQTSAIAYSPETGVWASWTNAPSTQNADFAALNVCQDRNGAHCSVTGRAATTTPCSISASRACSPIWHWPAAMDDMRD